ncbi:hypothetical protein HDU82_007334 [Entophlyctis luteolus]|nr:hypothetical protein HDU82_007334 [Entophlyctis luteolus]KAJ3389122.1 hypothetical protein HDU84_009126 [Entophlyctis sp. JEL0112]
MPVKTWLFAVTTAAGTILSAIVLYALLANNGRLIKSRLERAILMLDATSFLWSLLTSARLIVFLVAQDSPTPELLSQVEGAAVYISVGWLMCSNIVLALSRYFAFSNKSESETAKYFIPFILYFTAVSAVIMWAYAVAPPNVVPDLLVLYPPSRANTNAYKAWAGVVSWTGIASVLAIATIYALTYFRIQAQLRQIPMGGPGDSALRLHIERTVFWKCVVMAAATFLCYFPAAVALVILAVLRPQTMPLAIDVAAIELYLLDAVVTPVLVLYFMQPVRARVVQIFSRWLPSAVVQKSAAKAGSTEFHLMAM